MLARVRGEIYNKKKKTREIITNGRLMRSEENYRRMYSKINIIGWRKKTRKNSIVISALRIKIKILLDKIPKLQ